MGKVRRRKNMIYDLFCYLLLLLMMDSGVFQLSFVGNILCSGAPVQYGNGALNTQPYALQRRNNSIDIPIGKRLPSNATNPLPPPGTPFNIKSREKELVCKSMFWNPQLKFYKIPKNA